MPNEQKRYALHQSPLYRLRSKRKLAQVLKIAPAELRRLCKHTNERYSEFDRPKKGGGTRRIENPQRPLKILQARVARLLSRVQPPDYLFCPVKGRSYVTNAAQHRGNRVIHSFDIQKYFPSTRSRRVYWFFRTVMKCERDIAAIMTSVATYRGYLPTGSPLSPIMAFFAHYDVWQAVWKICEEQGYTLTVYIDDVTVSGASVSTQIMWEIKRLIHGAGLRYHKEKVYLDRPAEITGVIVDGARVSPPHRQFERLHSATMMLAGEKNGAVVPAIRGLLAGLKGQIAQIQRIQS